MDVPSLKKHPTGQGYVWWKGKPKYFGKYGLPTTDRAYWRWRETLGAEANGGRTVGEIINLYEQYGGGDIALAEKQGIKKMERAKTSRLNNLRDALGSISGLDANSYSPSIFREHRAAVAGTGTRVARQVNDLMKFMRHIIKWGYKQGFVKAEVWSALRIVDELKDDDVIKQPIDREPANPNDVYATLPFLSDVTWAMIQLQMLTGGARPGEIVSLKKSEINKTDLPGLWFSELTQHKTAKKSKKRWLVFNKDAQEILSNFIDRGTTDWVFPSDLIPGSHYRESSLRQAVGHACKAAGVKKWTPYQIRHMRGTEITVEKGLEDAAKALGHYSTSTTQIYQHLPSAEDIRKAVTTQTYPTADDLKQAS